jgi:hypothetical protein
MTSRVIAHDIDDALPRLAGIVQKRNGIGEARSQMQQGRCRLSGHAGIAVCRARHHRFEQAQYAAHPGFAVQRRHEMHFGGAGIAEADFNTAVGKGMDQGFGAVHAPSKQARIAKTSPLAADP